MAQALRQRGYKLTSQRLAVVQVLHAGNERMIPSEVMERGRRICPTLGLTTVYRTLDLLGELGFVRRLHGQGRCRGYARVDDRNGHHLVCQRCRQVIDFSCSGLEELIAQTSRRTGFSVQSHLLELTGLCPACQRSQPSVPGGGAES